MTDGMQKKEDKNETKQVNQAILSSAPTQMRYLDHVCQQVALAFLHGSIVDHHALRALEFAHHRLGRLPVHVQHLWDGGRWVGG